VYAVTDGEKIEEMRLARSLSREELAQAAGLALSTVSKVERSGRVRLKTARRVANVFGVSPRSLTVRSRN
jgi:transcriptional regulator with XRE-family HTH domain